MPKIVKNIEIEKNCRNFDYRLLCCNHRVTIYYTDDTSHKLLICGNDIYNNYKDFIPADLEAHFAYSYDKIIYENNIFTVINHMKHMNHINHINKEK